MQFWKLMKNIHKSLLYNDKDFYNKSKMNLMWINTYGVERRDLLEITLVERAGLLLLVHILLSNHNPKCVGPLELILRNLGHIFF